MWYKSWFNTPYYHMLYRRRDEQEAAAFLDQLLKYLKPAKQDWILDLACGKGRHSIYMNRMGYRVEGIDISDQNIAYAKTFENEGLKFTLHDMRDPYRTDHFGLVMNLFTSFGYFDLQQENLAVLKASHINLKPKGRLIIDYFNVELLRKTLVAEEMMEVDGVEFKIERSITNGSIVKKIEINDGGKLMHFEERVKALDKQDFVGILAQSGFELLDIFGNYALDQYKEVSSPRLILIARKYR